MPMKIFKSIDEQLLNLGFEKVQENKYGVAYERNNGTYVHKVAILHKASGKHIAQSYDSSLYAGKNPVVGLTYKEMRLFLKKMKQMGLHKEDQNATKKIK